MLSIIIPTWNEENYLPKLLHCIKKQTYKNYEVIIIDSNSTDKTVEIAKKYGFKVFLESKKIKSNPGTARNLGAKNAKGDLLLFLNADMQLDNDFLFKVLNEFKERNLDIAGILVKPLSDRLIDKLILGTFNLIISAVQFFYPNACGDFILCKKWLHEKVQGFDETILLGEDLDYMQRCGKYGKFRIIKCIKTYFSMRRFDNEGRLKVVIRHTLSAIYRFLLGQVRNDIFKYNLHYPK